MFLAGLPSDTCAQSTVDKAALFDQVFGAKEAAAKTYIPVEIMFDGREAGMTTIVMANDGTFVIEAEALIQVVAVAATQQTLTALRSLAEQAQLARPAQFSDLGIQMITTQRGSG